MSISTITTERLRRLGELLPETDAAIAQYKQVAREQVARQTKTDQEAESIAGAGNDSVGERILGTGLDVLGQVTEGMLESGEGLVDAAAGMVGVPVLSLVDALTGASSRRALREWIEREYVGMAADWVHDTLADKTGLAVRTASYQSEGGVGSFFRNVEQGVGNMLPAVAVTLATGGTALPVALKSALPLMTTGVSAGGQGMEEAYRDGASDWGGLGYGVASGTVEAATEKLFGGTGKAVTGKGWLDDVVPSTASKGAARIGRNMLEEGTEEAIAEMATPTLRTIYQGTEALEAYRDPTHYQNVAEAFALGGVTSLAYSGTVGYGLSRRGIGHVGRAADVESLLEDIEGLGRKQRNARLRYRLTPTLNASIETEVSRRWRDIESILTRADPKEREILRKTFSLGSATDEDGRLTDDFLRKAGMLASKATPAESARTDTGHVRRSIAYTTDNRPVAVIDEDILAGVPKEKWTSRAREVMSAFSSGVPIAGRLIKVNKVSRREFTHSRSTQYYRGTDGQLYADKMRSAGHIDDVILAGTNYINEDLHHSRKDSIRQFARGEVALRIGGQDYMAEIIVGYTDSSDMILYDIVHMKRAQHDLKKITGARAGGHQETASRAPAEGDPTAMLAQEAGVTGPPSDTSSIPQSLPFVNPLHPEFYKGDPQNIIRALTIAEKIPVTDPESLTPTERKNYMDFLRIHERLDAVADGHINFALTEGDGQSDGMFVSGVDVILLSRTALASSERTGDALAQGFFGVTMEEVLHFTAEHGRVHREYKENDMQEKARYGRFFDLMMEDKAAVKAVTRELIDLGYFGTDPGKAAGYVDRLLHKKPENMTEIEREDAAKLYDELVAHLGRHALSTEHFYRRLMMRERSAAEQLLRAIRRFFTKTEGETSRRETDTETSAPVEKAVIERVKLVENAFLDAIAEAGCFVDPMGHILSDEGEAMQVKYSRITPNPDAGKPLTEKKTYVRESRKKSSEPTGTDRATFEMYRNIESLVDSLVYEEGPLGAHFEGKISERLRGAIWQKVRAAVDASDRRHLSETLADEIMNAAVVEYVVSDEEQSVLLHEREVLRTYMHKLDVSPYRGDLVAFFGKKGYQSLMARFGMAKKGTAIPPDTLKPELSERLGYAIPAENPADVVAWMERKWQAVKASIQKPTETALTIMKGTEEYESHRRAVADEIFTKLQDIQWDSAAEHLKEYYDHAYKSAMKVAKDRIDAYMKTEREKLQKREKRRRDQEEVSRFVNRAVSKARNIKDWKAGTFKAASEIGNREVLAALEELSRTLVQGNISVTGTRKAMKRVLEWYRRDQTKAMLGAMRLPGTDVLTGGMYSPEIESMLETLADAAESERTTPEDVAAENADPGSTRPSPEKPKGIKPFTPTEARYLCHVLDHFKKLIETFHKVRMHGQWVDAVEIATGYIAKAETNPHHVRYGKLRGCIDRYRTDFADPMTVARFYDGYIDGGFLTDMLDMFRRAECDTELIRHTMTSQIRDFLKTHKNYLDNASQKTLNVCGDDIPLMSALYLYMALKRDQAVRHLLQKEYAYTDQSGKIQRSSHLILGTSDLPMSRMKQRAAEIRAEIRSQCTDSDIAFVALCEKLFNDDCKRYKSETDMTLHGFTNVLDDYYIPIRIADRAVRVDEEAFFPDLDRATNASFNQQTKEGARNAIVAGNLAEVLMRHIDGIARYAGMSEALMTYEQLLNIHVAERGGTLKNLKKAYETIWPDMDQYIRKLVSDMQHLPSGYDAGLFVRMIEWARSKYAVASLGANPKVLLTQFSSLFSATSIVDGKYVLRSLTAQIGEHGRADMDRYCTVAMLRNADNTAVRAQGLLDNVSKVGEFCTSLIGKTDRFVVSRLWHACLLQTAAEGHLAIDSEENKTKAGELLARVIYETQQNSQATEKSLAMRSKNPLNKMLTMFTADAMKTIGRVLDAYGSYKAAKGNAAKQQACKNQLGRAVGALVSSSLYMVILSTLMRKFLAKDDEDELDDWSMSDIREGLGDMAVTLLGGLPLVSDVADFFVSGFDIEDMGIGAFNDLLGAVRGLGDLCLGLVSGKIRSEDAAVKIRLLAYAAGRMTGIPVQNIYNYLRGIVHTVNDDVIYAWDDLFSTRKTYRSDMARAIEEGDDDRVAVIAALLLDESTGLAENSIVRRELDRLVRAGYPVYPPSVGQNITYKGSAYPLTRNQQKQFRKIYEGANEAARRLVGSSYYAKSTDTVKTKSLARTYQFYYNKAVEDLLGMETEEKAQLFAKAIPPEKLAVIIAEASTIKADRDSTRLTTLTRKDPSGSTASETSTDSADLGSPIPGSRRRKIAAYIESLHLTAAQKYLTFAYLGYKTSTGHEEVRQYLNTLSLSRTEREMILRSCGIE